MELAKATVNGMARICKTTCYIETASFHVDGRWITTLQAMKLPMDTVLGSRLTVKDLHTNGWQYPRVDFEDGLDWLMMGGRIKIGKRIIESMNGCITPEDCLNPVVLLPKEVGSGNQA